MKKCVRSGLILLVFVGCLSAYPARAAAQTGISYMLVIPRPGASVLIQPPGVSEPVAISSLRTIASPEEIAPDNAAPFTVICPDLTEIEVLPQETFSCPEPPPVLMAEVEVPPPPPVIIGPDPTRGRELLELSSEEQNALQEARKVIERLAVAEQPAHFLLASLYASYDVYKEAIQVLENHPQTTQDPASLRLLGILYLKNNAPDLAYDPLMQALELSQSRGDKEGQALAHYYLAVAFDHQGQCDESFLDHVRQALSLCQELEYAPMVDKLQELLQQPH